MTAPSEPGRPIGDGNARNCSTDSRNFKKIARFCRICPSRNRFMHKWPLHEINSTLMGKLPANFDSHGRYIFNENKRRSTVGPRKKKSERKSLETLRMGQPATNEDVERIVGQSEALDADTQTRLLPGRLPRPIRKKTQERTATHSQKLQGLLRSHNYRPMEIKQPIQYILTPKRGKFYSYLAVCQLAEPGGPRRESVIKLLNAPEPDRQSSVANDKNCQAIWCISFVTFEND